MFVSRTVAKGSVEFLSAWSVAKQIQAKPTLDAARSSEGGWRFTKIRARVLWSKVWNRTDVL